MIESLFDGLGRMLLKARPHHIRLRTHSKTERLENLGDCRGSALPGEKLATENGIDAIIIGVHRRSKVGKLVFGATAQYVILTPPARLWR